MAEGISSDRTPPIPSGIYTDAAFHALEHAAAFANCWVAVGRADEIPEAGCYFTWERTRVPLLLIHGADHRIRAFYNSCRHRGAPVVRDARGRNRAFRCQYHSWTYDTTGCLIAVPDQRDFFELNRADRPLIQLRVAEHGGWLFVNQDEHAEPLNAFLGSSAPILDGLNRSGTMTVDREVLTFEANWKAVLERAMELLAGHDVHLIFPNMLTMRDADEAGFLMAWPRDQRMTDLEIVRCAQLSGAGQSPADDAARKARGTALRERLEDELGKLSFAGAGARTPIGETAALRLAVEIARRIGEENVPSELRIRTDASGAVH